MPDNGRELVSIVIASYNRAETLGRAVRSVLQQTHPDVEAIVVDDGSTDRTPEVLAGIHDPRLRLFRFEKNRGVAVARNTGLDSVRGSWFTFLDSDDELVPEAVETLLRVPREIDPSITHVECNCVDGTTGRFTGEGLDRDQYLTEEIIVTKMRHDHWGMFATAILGGDRFNEALPGYEDALWSRLRDRVKSYYIHRALKVVHRGSGDRLSVRRRSAQQEAHVYRSLLAEHAWFEKRRRYLPDEYARECFWGMVFTLMDGDRASADKYFEMLGAARGGERYRSLARLLRAGGPVAARAFIGARGVLKKAPQVGEHA